MSESRVAESTTQSVCVRCGARVASTVGWRDVCVHCLLRSVLDPEHVDHDGTLKRSDDGAPIEFGDYELLGEIGRGGQGLVFRARQMSLNRTVALKIISLGQWASKAHLKRFRREAEAAASLDHPGIVPIYEVGEHEGQYYFSMKFVEGGQLDEVVKREPLSIRRAAELIAKVARTVHYAHQHGILHCDIKPGNILLDSNSEPHLTDFGIARLVETESDVTRTLEVLGTPGYMAPEQAMGRNKQLTSATDVYGLGAVLYQLLTRHPPFAGETSYATIKLLLDTEPRSPRLLNSKVDRDLSTICLKCLEKEPQRRYSSALALAEDLEHWLKHEPIQAQRTGIFRRGCKWVQRKPAIAAVFALSLALGAAMGWNIWKSEPINRPLTNGIAVLPFENLSGDPDNAYFAEGIQDEILTRLAKIAELKVISRTSTLRYQSKAKNLREIAKQLGVANILEGSVRKAGDQVRVTVQLINAETDTHLWADSYDRKLTDVLDVEVEIARRIAESLQSKLSGREEQALAAKPTNNSEAYDAYLRGLAFEGRSSSSSFLSYSGDLLWKAAGFYERTVELDPDFAVAWARLCRVDADLYMNRDTTDWGARSEAAKRALENAQRLEPNSPETLLALGYYQYRVLRDYPAARTTFRRVSKMLPGNSDVPWALGRVLRREGNWEESVAQFEQALNLDPRNVGLLMDAAFTYSMLRRFQPALKNYERALDIKPNDPDVTAAKAGIYQAQGNLQEAAKYLSEVNWQTPFEDTFQIKIAQLRLERNYGAAVGLLQARLAQFHFASPYEKAVCQVALAFTQRFAGDMAGSKATGEAARDTLEQLSRNQPDNYLFLAVLSLAYAAMGEQDSALKAAEHAIEIYPTAQDRAWGPGFEENLALVQTIFEENGQAIPTLTRLLQTPYEGWYYRPTPITPALLRLDPIWDPLRGDPVFQKLCQ